MFKWLANLYWKFDFWLSAELKPAGDELKELFKRDIPRTAEELELDKKRKKSEQFWDDSDEMDRQCSPGNSMYLDNTWHKW